ncbi:major cell-surface adhesin PAc precursor [Geobacter sp. OR-1]|uniref:DUF5684 domain-containing protein n=1 Tax=Geobacter sp. OR-1 TaxID=1266765 RepID=UPI000542BAA3|nr:DUF5684 domain-containing protein [Geobacter sp. OR-1]GAM09037.1 major cell-surface adhesin PAc precursor [Geobacter sp. OR-1]
MRTVHGVAALALFCLFALTGVSHARSVYLKDGGIIECQWVKRAGDEIIVKVNRDIVVTFSRDEIDLNKTFARKHKRAGHKASLTAPEQPKPETAASAAPAVPPKTGKPPAKAVAQPAPAVTSKQTPPEKPAQKPSQPGKPAAAPSAAKPAPAPPPPAPTPPSPPLKKLPAVPVPPPGVPNLAALSSTVLVLLFALAIIMIAGNWKIFEKAGVAGWKCLIPIYNVYLLIVIAGKPGWWLLLMLVPIVSVAIYLLTMLALASKFGKGPLFGVGLFFLPMIFFPLLGFDNSEYSG